MHRKPFGLRQPCGCLLGRASSRIVNLRDRWLDPPVPSSIKATSDSSFDPEAHIGALPQRRLIHISAGILAHIREFYACGC